VLNFSAYSSTHTICATNKNDTSNCVTCWGRVCSYFLSKPKKKKCTWWMIKNGCKYPIDLLSHIYCCLVNFRKWNTVFLKGIQANNLNWSCDWPKESFLVWKWLVSYSLHTVCEFWSLGNFRPNSTISRDQIILSNIIGSYHLSMS